MLINIIAFYWSEKIHKKKIINPCADFYLNIIIEAKNIDLYHYMVHKICI